MKVTLFNIGKTETGFVKQAVDGYMKRINHLVDFYYVDLPNPKVKGNIPPRELKVLEGEIILKAVKGINMVILLDDKGKTFTSVGYAQWIESMLNRGLKHIAFISGGAWGFSDEVYKHAQFKISLSKMTFTHQLVRVIFIEQLYRAFTIIKGLPYHNE